MNAEEENAKDEPTDYLKKIHSDLQGIGCALVVIAAAVAMLVFIYAIQHPYK